MTKCNGDVAPARKVKKAKKINKVGMGRKVKIVWENDRVLLKLKAFTKPLAFGHLCFICLYDFYKNVSGPWWENSDFEIAGLAKPNQKSTREIPHSKLKPLLHRTSTPMHHTVPLFYFIT